MYNNLLDLGIESAHPSTRNSVSRGKDYNYCTLSSKTSPILKAERARWYPEDKKSVPRDVRITPSSIAHWFMGDGSASRGKNSHENTVFTRLYTNSFNIADVDFLMGKLLELGIYSRRNEVRKDQYIICIRQHSINDFMSMIQPFMCDSFSYKLATKRWTRESAVASLYYINANSKQRG